LQNSSREIVMRFLMSTVLFSVLSLTTPAQTQAPPASDNTPAGNADNGKKLYAQYGCYQCHGYAAQGGVGPRLAPRPLAFAAFSKYVRQPSGEMPPYTLKVFSDSQMAGVYSFLRSVPQPPPVDSIPLLKEN
jgi:mono/diheme cytochrome c family protein